MDSFCGSKRTLGVEAPWFCTKLVFRSWREMETKRATSSASSLRWSIDILRGSWDLIDNIILINHHLYSSSHNIDNIDTPSIFIYSHWVLILYHTLSRIFPNVQVILSCILRHSSSGAQIGAEGRWPEVQVDAWHNNTFGKWAMRSINVEIGNRYVLCR